VRVTKKLITVLDIKNLAADGQTELYVEPGTIITPAARDEAAQRGLVLRTQGLSTPTTNSQKAQEPKSLDPKLVEEIVQQVLAALSETQAGPVVKETDPSGMIFIRESCCNNKQVQEILSKEESPKLGCGFLNLDSESFAKQADWDEVNYILEGTVNISVNNRTYQRKAGDVFYIPKGAKVVLSAKRKAQIFFVVNRCC